MAISLSRSPRRLNKSQRARHRHRRDRGQVEPSVVDVRGADDSHSVVDDHQLRVHIYLLRLEILASQHAIVPERESRKEANC
jgi:hypothetical protein